MAEEFAYEPSIRFFTLGPRELSHEVREFVGDTQRYLNALEAIYGRLELIPEATPQVSAFTSSMSGEQRIFIVHGRDEEALHVVASFVRQLGLKPIILREQASGGRTIIEKLEWHSKSDYAIVLLTPDDVGALKPEPAADAAKGLKPRARQNVILELGYFLALLGRARVFPLIKAEVEQPSDILGIVYVPMDGFGGWKRELCKELLAVGIEFNARQAF